MTAIPCDNHIRQTLDGVASDHFESVFATIVEDLALARLDELEATRGKQYPAIAQSWRRHWQYVVPFFAFPPAIRIMIYTTNAVESVHRSLRKIIKTRGSFPTDEAALKLLYLAFKNAGLRWRSAVAWTEAMSKFAIVFGDRFPGSAR